MSIRRQNSATIPVYRNATFQLIPWTKWGITIEILVIGILEKKTTNWTCNRIVIVNRKYIVFDVEMRPHHAI